MQDVKPTFIEINSRANFSQNCEVLPYEHGIHCVDWVIGEPDKCTGEGICVCYCIKKVFFTCMLKHVYVRNVSETV